MIATPLNKFPTPIFDIRIVSDTDFVIEVLIVRIGQFVFDIDELTLLFTWLSTLSSCRPVKNYFKSVFNDGGHHS